jgi:hypothetical protein
MASPEEQAAAMVRNLEDKTGRLMAEWLAIVTASGLAKHGQIVKMLKSDHAMTHGYANLVAHEAMQSAAAYGEADDLIAAQYAGKESLRPIWDRVQAVVAGFGGDVEVAPKKAYVSLRRAKQFALVQPSTKSRVDIGIQLKGVAPSGRLEASGSFNSMVSHRVRVGDAKEVDQELIDWLQAGYDAAG